MTFRHPEDRGNTYLQNVGKHLSHSAEIQKVKNMIKSHHENQETHSTIIDNRWRNYWSSWYTEEYL